VLSAWRLLSCSRSLQRRACYTVHIATKADKQETDPIAELAIESDELHQPEIDAFIARNRDALNESVSQSLDELARGVKSDRTIQDIIADGLRRHGQA
jgi:hypothetical protein